MAASCRVTLTLAEHARGVRVDRVPLGCAYASPTPGRRTPRRAEPLLRGLTRHSTCAAFEVQYQQMGMVTEGALLGVMQRMQKDVERTNKLLEQLVAEMKHANELTHWQIDKKVAV
jgi:hypothetical protein